MSVSDKIVDTLYSKRGTSEQNNPHPSPSTQSWGVQRFLQVAQEWQALIINACLQNKFRQFALNGLSITSYKLQKGKIKLVVPLFELPTENAKHPNSEWKGRGVDCS